MLSAEISRAFFFSYSLDQGRIIYTVIFDKSNAFLITMIIEDKNCVRRISEPNAFVGYERVKYSSKLQKKPTAFGY